MNIPKIIHYCWFGGSQLSPKALECIESWKKFCPDYEIIQWNEENYNVHKIKYIDEAYRNRKWAFVSDYARLDIVYQYGGIYLDTDVELCKGLDELLEESGFMSIEKYSCCINTGLGFGAKKGNQMILTLMKRYKNIPFVLENKELNLTPCPQYTTEFFMEYGYEKEDKSQRIKDCLILSSEFFCPMDFKTGVLQMTPNTIGIHWYEMSWFSESDKHILKMEKEIKRKLPNKLGIVVSYIYRKCYRLVEYTRKGILFKQFYRKMRK